jgi:hypothetical protein
MQPSHMVRQVLCSSTCPILPSLLHVAVPVMDSLSRSCRKYLENSQHSPAGFEEFADVSGRLEFRIGW